MSTDGVAWSTAYRERFGILPGDTVGARTAASTNPLPRGATDDEHNTARRRTALARALDEHEHEHRDDPRRLDQRDARRAQRAAARAAALDAARRRTLARD